MTTLADELALLDATGQADLVRRGEVTPVELVEAAVERIERVDPALNALVTPMYDPALEAAHRVRGGPFPGVSRTWSRTWRTRSACSPTWATRWSRPSCPG